MKYLCSLLLWQGAITAGFVVTTRTSRLVSSNLLKKETLLFSTEQNEDDKAAEVKSTSFSEAGKSIMDEQDQERMDAMGEFDSNPSYQNSDMERIREAIRARAEAAGAEKSVESAQYFEEAKQRAMEQAANRQQPGQLDLSQISTGNEPGGKKNDWDETLPTMLYDPADELTEAEQAEADPVGQLPVWEQAAYEIKESKWPDFPMVIRQVSLMALVVAVTGGIIINADSFLRDLYTDLGMLPRPEDIPGQLQDLDLPEGFTNNMNEDDLARITEEMNQVGKAAGLSSKSMETLMDSQNLNPDL